MGKENGRFKNLKSGMKSNLPKREKLKLTKLGNNESGRLKKFVENKKNRKGFTKKTLDDKKNWRFKNLREKRKKANLVENTGNNANGNNANGKKSHGSRT